MIQKIRNSNQSILVIGLHQKIIQSILDFDYVCGASAPSVVGIVSGGKRSHKCWFGNQEVIIPVFSSINKAATLVEQVNWLLNLTSANSVRETTELFFLEFPDAYGGHIFAENVSEQDALSIIETVSKHRLIAGCSGVGLLVPGAIKLGAIGGILGGNIGALGHLSGNCAIICSSGGMTNEIIDSLLRFGGAPSFAVSCGGERFPVTQPLEWCLEAESDEQTDYILLFGELGGIDEFEIAKAVQCGQIKKPIFAYIAGHYDTAGKIIQFGHAKALVKSVEESAQAKMSALSDVGVHVSQTYADFEAVIKKLQKKTSKQSKARSWFVPEEERQSSLFTAVYDRGQETDTFVKHILCNLLETNQVSEVLVEFTELAYSLLIDHGAEVSGAVNTMITARAGRDMGTSVASGLLTIGDRFGGAINAAAVNWYKSIANDIAVETLLVEHKQRGEHVMGIGHKKYSRYKSDPRVEKLIAFANNNVSSRVYLEYALAVAERTMQKKASLILNIDGAVAAIVLDLLVSCEHYSVQKLESLLDIGFFNSYFVVPRTIGFVGNYLSQARRDEGLFRLPPEMVHYE